MKELLKKEEIIMEKHSRFRKIVLSIVAACFIGLMVTPVVAKAEVVIQNKQFRYEILNNTITELNEVMTLNQLNQLIYDKYGFKIINKDPELNMDKKVVLEGTDKQNQIGSLLEQFLKYSNVSVQVDKNKIILKPQSIIYYEFPQGINVTEIKDKLNDIYENCSFKIIDKRLYIAGNDKDLTEVKEKMEALTKVINRVETVNFSFNSYNIDNAPDKPFLGYLTSDLYTKTKQKETSYNMKHNDKIILTFKDTTVEVYTDYLNNKYLVNGMEIPFDKSKEIGYVFKDGLSYYILYIHTLNSVMN